MPFDLLCCILISLWVELCSFKTDFEMYLTNVPTHDELQTASERVFSFHSKFDIRLTDDKIWKIKKVKTWVHNTLTIIMSMYLCLCYKDIGPKLVSICFCSFETAIKFTLVTKIMSLTGIIFSDIPILSGIDNTRLILHIHLT